MFKKFSRGFTLVELLVVLSIITLIATIILASLQSAREDAQDRRTKSDIREIQLSLELYYNQNGHYPIPESQGPSERYYCIGIPQDETCIFAGETKYGDPTLFSAKPKSPQANLFAAVIGTNKKFFKEFNIPELPERTVDGLKYRGYFYDKITQRVVFALTNAVVSQPAGQIDQDPNAGGVVPSPTGSGYEAECGNWFRDMFFYDVTCGAGWSKNPSGSGNASQQEDPFNILNFTWGYESCYIKVRTIQTNEGVCNLGYGCGAFNVNVQACVDAAAAIDNAGSGSGSGSDSPSDSTSGSDSNSGSDTGSYSDSGSSSSDSDSYSGSSDSGSSSSDSSSCDYNNNWCGYGSGGSYSDSGSSDSGSGSGSEPYGYCSDGNPAYSYDDYINCTSGSSGSGWSGYYQYNYDYYNGYGYCYYTGYYSYGQYPSQEICEQENSVGSYSGSNSDSGSYSSDSGSSDSSSSDSYSDSGSGSDSGYDWWPWW